MPNPVAQIFLDAAALNWNDPRRQNNVIDAGSPERVIIAGDIHGNRMNLHRILGYAFSADSPDTLLVLQEIIHGPPDERTGCDRSAESMARAARMKLKHPEKVIFLMGNHDLAQFTGKEIAKEGRGACEEFAKGLDHTFGEDAPEVLKAVLEFCRSMPLAVRFDNGVMACHSLPSPRVARSTEVDILDREPGQEDYLRGGDLYEWLWGRDQDPEQITAIADKLGAKFFVLGHRHIEDGMTPIEPCAVAIDSSNPLGRIMEFRGDEEISMPNVAAHIKRVSKFN